MWKPEEIIIERFKREFTFEITHVKKIESDNYV